MTSFARSYIWQAVASNARVIQFLLRELPADSPQWDARPDAERFSLREIIAHLNDYDTVSRERFEHIIREDEPEFGDWDPIEAAKHYDVRDPLHQVENLIVLRSELASWLEGLSDSEWQRTGTRPRAGKFSVEEGAALVVAHDAYHIAQIIEWLDATK
ncbi:DinB family protein [bacterium]|nr:MAG: DinB family protein [bacterium]